jgi:hypothetical protein
MRPDTDCNKRSPSTLGTGECPATECSQTRRRTSSYARCRRGCLSAIYRAAGSAPCTGELCRLVKRRAPQPPLRIDLPPVRDSSGRHRNSARRRPNGRAHSGSPPRYRTSARVSTKMFPATRASRRAGAASGCCERRVARREPPADFLLDRIQGSDALDRSGRRRRHKIHCDTTFSPRFQPKISVSFTTFEVLTQPPKTC